MTFQPARLRVAPLVLLAGLAVAVAGCGSSGQPAASPSSAGSADGSASAESATDAADSSAAVVDACALVTPEDITALLGVPIEGVSTSNLPQAPSCSWENPENYESVSVSVGSPETAINGTLPPLDPAFSAMSRPGPEGMRFMGPGVVDFVAGNRLNTVQVAVLSMLDGPADDAAVDLARKMIPQIPE